MTADGGDRADPEHLVVGHIPKAHGTKGELFVWPLTDRPESIFVPGHELLLGNTEGDVDADSAIVRIAAARPFKRGLLVRFEDCETREDADRLAQRYLLLPTEALPPLEEGEVFYHQLLGMAVETVAGRRVGTVREVYETEPHHLLAVETDDGVERLIPFAARFVREVSVERNVVVVDLPDGLLEL